MAVSPTAVPSSISTLSLLVITVPSSCGLNVSPAEPRPRSAVSREQTRDEQCSSAMTHGRHCAGPLHRSRSGCRALPAWSKPQTRDTSERAATTAGVPNWSVWTTHRRPDAARVQDLGPGGSKLLGLVKGHRSKQSGLRRRREFCHFADTTLSIHIETPAKGRGGCSRMVVSPTASLASGIWRGFAVNLRRRKQRERHQSLAER